MALDETKIAVPKVKDWVTVVTTEHHLEQQQKIIRFLFWIYSFLVIVTMTIFILQGFHLWGFSLDIKLLAWLGGATIGEIGGLLLLTLRAIFK